MTPSSPLIFTGERFLPELRGAIWHEHWHRYTAVLPLAKGKRVLDAACGEGYGSALLADEASMVIGIDIDAHAVRHARQRYAANPTLRYVQGSCGALPLPGGSIDLIVSFETIEHLSEQQAMLAEFRRVLAADGILIISSPNKPVYSRMADGSNHYHVRELDRDELAAMLAASFPAQAWYGQRVGAHSLLWSETRIRREPAVLSALADDRPATMELPAAPMYFVVVCAAAGCRLPELPALSLFDDSRQSLYGDYERALLAERRAALDAANERKIAAERLQEAIGAVNALSSARQREDALGIRIAALEADVARVQQALERTVADLQRATGELVALTVRQRDLERRLAYRESLRGWLRWPLSRIKVALSGLRP